MSREEMMVAALTPAECRQRLASATMGRIGMTVQALPVVLPVYFALDGEAVVIRTVAGTKLSAAIAGSVVAFEVDRHEDDGRGWSVMVQGRATEIHGEQGLVRARALGLPAFNRAGVPDHYIAVALEFVSGRVVGPAPGAGDGRTG